LQWLQQKDIWTLGELEYHLAAVYDVVYESKQSYYDLFEAADLSWKKTSKVNPKADPEVVAAKKSKSNGY
jgi:putative transposase